MTTKKLLPLGICIVALGLGACGNENDTMPRDDNPAGIGNPDPAANPNQTPGNEPNEDPGLTPTPAPANTPN